MQKDTQQIVGRILSSLERGSKAVAQPANTDREVAWRKQCQVLGELSGRDDVLRANRAFDPADVEDERRLLQERIKREQERYGKKVEITVTTSK